MFPLPFEKPKAALLLRLKLPPKLELPPIKNNGHGIIRHTGLHTAKGSVRIGCSPNNYSKFAVKSPVAFAQFVP
jgi:hypothetical protein